MKGCTWRIALVLISALCHGPVASAQQWSGIIDSSRAIDWSNAGIPGGIPNRSTICSTLNPGATAAQIDSAIANCPSGQVVKLNAGTYNLSTGITFANKSNVTLRGAGPDKTKLVFNGSNGCGGADADICLMGDSTAPGNGGTLANWTAGYAKGTNRITLSSVSGLSIGSIIFLDQLDDSNTDTRNIWICGTGGVCADEGPSGGQRSGRSQQQWVRVQSIAGNVVTIAPSIYMPNWSSSKSPQAWWASEVIKMSGIEDLSMDHGNSDGSSGIGMYNAYNCWIKNVRSINSNRCHVWLFTTAADVVRDSYFYGTKNAQSQSYGIESYLSSDVLVENNIFQHIVAPITLNGGSSGFVAAYNFSDDDYYTQSPTTMMGQIWLHSAGVDNVLLEGNSGAAFFSDDIHGTHHFVTAFRNYWIGWETGKTEQTLPIGIKQFGRYFNIIGNVLGKSGYHSEYQSGYKSAVNPDISIYEIGGGTYSVPAGDALVGTTLMRWGNYDVVNATTRFVSEEVPSAINPYSNAIPASQSLPPSFYLISKPSFFGSRPWPSAGPDISGGDIPDLSGHAYKIPARICYESASNDSEYSGNNVKVFNATRCYAETSLISPPKNIRRLP
jgi:hypothetical protein